MLPKGARKAQLPATFTEEHWQRCLEWWGHRCAYCNEPRDLFRKLEQEHIVAVVKGGGYVAENIIPACRTCNVTKGKRNLETWVAKTYTQRKAKQILDRIKAYVEWVKNQ